MKILNFIICDDIRREVGNKKTLVGTYVEKIVFPPHINWPINKQIAFYINLICEKSDPEFDEFILYFNLAGNELGKIKVDVVPSTIPLEKPLTFDFVSNVNFPSVGTLIIGLKFYKNNNEILSLPSYKIEIEQQRELISK